MMVEVWNVGCKIFSARSLPRTEVSPLAYPIYKRVSAGAVADVECAAVLHGPLRRLLHVLVGLTSHEQ